MSTKRADLLLVERGLFASRSRAQDAIAAGLVRANGAVVAKASALLSNDAGTCTPNKTAAACVPLICGEAISN